MVIAALAAVLSSSSSTVALISGDLAKRRKLNQILDKTLKQCYIELQQCVDHIPSPFERTLLNQNKAQTKVLCLLGNVNVVLQ